MWGTDLQLPPRSQLVHPHTCIKDTSNRKVQFKLNTHTLFSFGKSGPLMTEKESCPAPASGGAQS